MTRLLTTISIVALTALVSACTVAPLPAPRAPASAPQAMLKPGDKVGEMTLIKGAGKLDLDVPPYVAFCNSNPMLAPGSTVSKPGIYAVECTVPPLPKMVIGFGWPAKDEKLRDSVWAALSTELYVNEQLVDQEAFGKFDDDYPAQGVSSDDPAKQAVSEGIGKLRAYDVILENLKPGTLTLRQVYRLNQEISDGWITSPAGTYDITWKMTIQDPIAMIDAFHAATNKHDIDAALAFFTPDATVQFPNQPPPNVYKGAAEIRKWLEGDAAQNIHVTTENVQAKGDRITWTAKVDTDDLRPLGITATGRVEVTVRDGKIASFSFFLDDATLAKLQAIPTATPAK